MKKLIKIMSIPLQIVAVLLLVTYLAFEYLLDVILEEDEDETV